MKKNLICQFAIFLICILFISDNVFSQKEIKRKPLYNQNGIGNLANKILQIGQENAFRVRINHQSTSSTESTQKTTVNSK